MQGTIITFMENNGGCDCILSVHFVEILTSYIIKLFYLLYQDES